MCVCLKLENFPEGGFPIPEERYFQIPMMILYPVTRNTTTAK